MRRRDGSAGDTDYGAIGSGYVNYRQPEPAIAEQIRRALGGAKQVLNVGAGAGSYEPDFCAVTAVEPSAAIRAQRPPGLVAAIDATAEDLPFSDKTFAASMATFTVHQWGDVARGLAEMRRVTAGPVVILTCDPARVCDFWLYEYAPEVLETEARRYPAIEVIAKALGDALIVADVPIPLLCRDGFNEAYYGRPEMFLEAGARQACSAWSFVEAGVVARTVARLRADLASGAWDKRYGHLRGVAEFCGSLRLLTARL